jgi:multidrug efflux pump subunit AcrB
MAERLEKEVFPNVLKGNPSTVLSFIGEVQDSRESQSDFSFALILVLALIYVLLVFLFDSLSTPFLIAAIIPFGAAGVILALAAHGMWQYGFFAVVGALGMTGVVINDSIVMLNKFENSLDTTDAGLVKKTLLENIAELSKTRFRAVLVTTLTTVAGLLPTAYGVGGYDSMLAEMMLAMAWGLFFGMFITLFLMPLIYSYYIQLRHSLKALI